MSIFNGGGGSLSSTTLTNALFEAARLLDAAETSRNANNPTLPPKQNISTTVDFGTKSVAIAATLPAVFNTGGSGSIVIVPTDYLGAVYGSFNPGAGGTLNSVSVMGAFVEIAQLLSSEEKEVTPVDDQPNNVQVTFDAEALTVTVTANLPVFIDTLAEGKISLAIVDYL